ncbi:MAG: META domain-containing protein [Actinomycetales bacterium]
MMKTMRSAALVVAVAGAFALAGCSASPGAQSSSSPSSSQGSAFVGAWGEAATGKPSLTIAADGAFNGTDGCNAMAGKGKFSGGKFVFGPFASTMMACEGVHPWLNLANTASVSGNTLTVYKTDGSALGTLAKR